MSFDLGVYGATVVFSAEGPDCHQQRTATGRRDVRRLEPVPGSRQVALLAYMRGRTWRAAGGDTAVAAEARTADAGSALVPALAARLAQPSAAVALPGASAPPGAPAGPAHDGGLAAESPAALPPAIAAAVGAPAASAAPPVGSERWVTWVSVDPRRGCINIYPGEVSRQLERALRAGESSVTLGPAFFDAVVVLQDPPYQRTARGRRDVRRVVLADAGDAIVLHLTQQGPAWHVAEGEAEETEERRATAQPDDVVELATVGATSAPAAAGAPPASVQASSASSAPPPPRFHGEGAASSAGIPAAPRAALRRPVWQWCREDRQHPSTVQRLPETAWGVYSEEQNAEIEAAFQAQKTQAEVSVGIRSYTIIFGPEEGFARQVDQALLKRRLVRRRLLLAEDCERLLRPPAPEVARDQENCAICCLDFADTAAMPTLELPGCQHVFHRACAQQLADADRPCPFCRGAVDWAALGLRSGARRRADA